MSYIAREISGVGAIAVAAIAAPIALVAGTITGSFNFVADKIDEQDRKEQILRFKPAALGQVLDLLEQNNIKVPSDRHAACLIDQAVNGYTEAAIGNRYKRSSYDVPEGQKPWWGLYERKIIKTDLIKKEIENDTKTYAEFLGPKLADCNVLIETVSNPAQTHALINGLRSISLKANFTSQDKFTYGLEFSGLHRDQYRSRDNNPSYKNVADFSYSLPPYGAVKFTEDQIDRLSYLWLIAANDGVMEDKEKTALQTSLNTVQGLDDLKKEVVMSTAFSRPSYR